MAKFYPVLIENSQCSNTFNDTEFYIDTSSLYGQLKTVYVKVTILNNTNLKECQNSLQIYIHFNT